MLITVIPLSESSLPVKPEMSHEGDHLQRIAQRHSLTTAISRVRFAPTSNSRVSSAPVTSLRRFLSAQVIQTRWPRRLTGARGTDKPPRTSGQTGTHSTSLCREAHLSRNGERRTAFPCHLTASPKRHLDTNTFIAKIISYKELRCQESSREVPNLRGGAA